LDLTERDPRLELELSEQREEARRRQRPFVGLVLLLDLFLDLLELLLVSLGLLLPLGVDPLLHVRHASPETFLMLEGSRDEGAEQGVRLRRLRPELGVELRPHEERVVPDLDDLDELPVGREPREDRPLLLEPVAVGVVELEAVAVPLVDLGP